MHFTNVFRPEFFKKKKMQVERWQTVKEKWKEIGKLKIKKKSTKKERKKEADKRKKERKKLTKKKERKKLIGLAWFSFFV